MALNHRMAEEHEAFVVDLLGGRLTRGSGSQWHNQLDGRQDHREERFAFGWECKSTLGKSISVTRERWDKLEEQAQGLRPLLPMRFYRTERLHVDRDLVAMDIQDLAELLDAVKDR